MPLVYDVAVFDVRGSLVVRKRGQAREAVLAARDGLGTGMYIARGTVGGHSLSASVAAW